MRSLIVAVVMVLITNMVKAQTFDEWFKQKETQIKYLIEQIAALEAYGEVVNRGYDIAHNGLTNVFGSKEADYKQHNSYFLSLWKVKPEIRNYSKVFSVYQMKGYVDKQQQLFKSSVTNFLVDKETDYINSVYSNLVGNSNNLISELYLITRDDQLQLKDDERINRVNRIYLEMERIYEFSQSFTNQAIILIANRLEEMKQTDKLSSLYGIK